IISSYLLPFPFILLRPPFSPLFPYTTLFRSLLPERAVQQWNAGNVDAVVVSNRDAPEVMNALKPAGIVSMKSGQCIHHFGSVTEIGRAQSELQSQSNLVCRLLLEKKKKKKKQ